MIVYDLGPSPQRTPWHIGGEQEFQQTGWSAAAGQPYADNAHMLVLDSLGKDIEAKLAGVPILFPQCGQVRVYNISSDRPVMRSWFDGDRFFGRFGGKVKVLLVIFYIWCIFGNFRKSLHYTTPDIGIWTMAVRSRMHG